MQINVGDMITFRAICRWSTRRITRRVDRITSDGRYVVKAYECDEFYVRMYEISKVNGEEFVP